MKEVERERVRGRREREVGGEIGEVRVKKIEFGTKERPFSDEVEDCGDFIEERREKVKRESDGIGIGGVGSFHGD